MKVFALTLFTLVAFAANSLLCRMALGGTLIDPISFAAIRLVSGAAALLVVSGATGRGKQGVRGSWISGIALFTYATAFSLAYLSLSTGTGAIILFGAVQVTMIGSALRSGERILPPQWVGLTAAIVGLVYLVLPGLSAPDPVGAILMGLAGVAWGAYSIRGRRVISPVPATAGNFVWSVPFALVARAVAPTSLHFGSTGIVIALISGVVTSGLGYVVWYRVLGSLSTTQASVVQLLVPVLAAAGGVLFLAEQVSLRLVIASALILGGVTIAVLKPQAVHEAVRE